MDLFDQSNKNNVREERQSMDVFIMWAVGILLALISALVVFLVKRSWLWTLLAAGLGLALGLVVGYQIAPWIISYM